MLELKPIEKAEKKSPKEIFWEKSKGKIDFFILLPVLIVKFFAYHFLVVNLLKNIFIGFESAKTVHFLMS
jgi:hypothetical protein